eukprot:NODE_1810_length_1058_cov_288.389831.p1 GENE.NODE_1810_length_1058_cov_288.389831~~NODE_1810_length_1058_cov_288.389831.p1  ORF type:complete len:277 (-),score=67.29 NODE_1810_length_1058_cov_288.389831:212-934(-)
MWRARPLLATVRWQWQHCASLRLRGPAAFRGTREVSGNAAAATALAKFREQAGAEVVSATGASGVAPVLQLGPRLRQLAGEELSSTFGSAAEHSDDGERSVEASRRECKAQMTRDVEGMERHAEELGELRRERRHLEEMRADLLAVGFQSSSTENLEFGALVICAAAGIFAVTIHYNFFAIFAVSFLLYRKSTASVRKQHAALDDLDGLIERLREVKDLEQKAIAALRRRAEEWSEGVVE